MNRPPFLSEDCPPMGIYETLYAFRDSFGKFMGERGTHPWSQGFPLTTQLEGGPPLPSSVEVTWEDRFYPKAWGHPKLREAIAGHYNDFYGSSIAPENVMVFAGGRPGIFAVLAFLKQHVEVRIAGRRVAGLPRHPDADRVELARRAVDAGERLPSAERRLLRPRGLEREDASLAGDLESRQPDGAHARRRRARRTG